MGYDTRKFHSNVTGSAVMRPIELSRIRENGTLEPLYINPAHIVSFITAWASGGAFVTLTTTTYSVAETPEQIVGRLADHRSAMHAEEHDGIEIFR